MKSKAQLALATLAVAASTILVWSSSGGIGQNHTSTIAGENTIAGVWRTVVTARNCQTGVPGTASLRGLFTFNQGGTMSEWGVGPGSSPALRSPGHGVWQREHGSHNYSFTFTFYRYDASGVLTGSQRVTASLELGASGDEFTSSSVIEVFDANDNLIGSGCGAAVGTRSE